MREENIFDKIGGDIAEDLAKERNLPDDKQGKMHVRAKIIKIKLNSVFRDKPEASTRGNVEVYLDEKKPLAEVIKEILVTVIAKEIQEKIIGDSNWRLESIEGIELCISGKFGPADILKLP